MNAAQMKAEDMAKQQFFAHTAPDGTVAWDYFKKVGYAYEIAGENLAITNETAEAVINGWLNSPTHRENLLNSHYKDFGIGMAHYGTYQGHNNTWLLLLFTDQDLLLKSRPLLPTLPDLQLLLSQKYQPFRLLYCFICGLILAGIFLELRHIQHLHHLKA